jgi:xanthine dehydrogenase YagS FAD-binding subunit
MRSFDYIRAGDAASAVQAAGARAQFLAGGTTLLDLMKLDVMRPEVVVDVGDLAKSFGRISRDANGLHLGAFAHMSEAADHPDVLKDYPVVAQSLQLAASAQIRNMAMLGGNVLQRTRCTYFRDPSWAACNKREPGSGCAALGGVNRKHAVLGASDACIATYPGDFAQALIALDASLDIVGPSGARVMPFAALHVVPGATPARETTLAPGELITGFTLPALPWARRSLYLKIRDRQSYEFALASAAVALDLDGETVREARIALGGVATKPWRAREAEAVLAGGALTPQTAQRAAEAAFAGAVTHGQNDFKPDLGRRTLLRALLQAAALEV